jgi:2-polyprenyl-3-methyl-5-hydroxy-6-metoxy-1,4-benzoquinol methylase
LAPMPGASVKTAVRQHRPPEFHPPEELGRRPRSVRAATRASIRTCRHGLRSRREQQVEEYTVLEVLGDLTGLSVLDLACGEGYYSRLFRANGASRVVGVDLSEKMIELARASEAQSPLGIEYAACDVAVFRPDERFERPRDSMIARA